MKRHINSNLCIRPARHWHIPPAERDDISKSTAAKALQLSPSTSSPLPTPITGGIASLPSSLPPLPTLTLATARNTNHLADFLAAHLSLPLTPSALLHFLKSKLHHHPHFTLYDFHIFNWASTVDSYRHDHSTFEWMVRTLAMSSRFDDLLQLLQFVASSPCPCSDGIFSCSRTEPIFHFAVDSLCRVGRFDDAVAAFETMVKLIDGRPRVETFNALIHGLLKSNEHYKARAFYDRMIGSRVKPDVITFNILINGHCRNSQFELALDVFKEMKDKGCRPNVVSFNTLIKGFFREKKIEEGIAMAYEMIELGCPFSTVTCEILVDGLCREGHADKASELLLDFSSKGVLPDGFDYYCFIEVLCNSGFAAQALAIVTHLWERGNSPSLIACITLVEGLRRLRRTREAVGLMEKMLKFDLLPDIVTFNCLLEDLCNVGKTVEANRLKVLGQSKGLKADEVTYRILVCGFTKEKRRKEGEVLVDEMLDEEFIPDLPTYNRFMQGLATVN